MAERIEITDPKLAARVESTIAELRQYYPDGVIKSLQAQHKTLSKWVAKLWKEVGYESREDFLSAYGFEGSKAGGQAKWTRESAEEMFSELARRYEGKEKPRDIEELKEQNPDFSSGLRTVTNKSKELFGGGLAKELKKWGVLAGPLEGPGDISDEQIEAMLQALSSIYRDSPSKPTSLDELAQTHPEYGVVLKAFSLRSKSIYGTTPVKRMRELDILVGPRETPGDISDEQIDAVLQMLSSIYRDSPTKPTGLDELARTHPEYGVVLKAFSLRSKSIYGTTPVKQMRKLGILDKPDRVAKPARVSKEEIASESVVEKIEQAIDELGKILCDVPSERKPYAIPQLASEYPELTEMLRGKDKKDFAIKERLQLLGILASNKTQVRERGIRREPIEELLPEFRAVASTQLFEPGSEGSGLLPPHVKELDLDNGVELREMLVTIVGGPADGMSVGDRFDVSYLTKLEWMGVGHGSVKRRFVYIKCEPQCLLTEDQIEEVFDGLVERSSSPLMERVGARVVTKSVYGGVGMAQLELCYLAEINRDTLAYVLRELGIVRESDLRGEMGWRFRIRMAQREGASYDSQ